MSARIAAVTLPAAAALAAQQSGHGVPSWLKFGAEMRGRVEVYSGSAQPFGDEDSYYLQRFRLNATISPQRWLTFYLEGQDSRVFGYRRRPIAGTVQNPADLRQACVESGSALEGPWALHAGRQDLTSGGQRLIGAGDWGNAGGTFDAVRLTRQKQYGRFDLFAASNVVTAPGMVDQSLGNIKLYGLYTALNNWIPSSLVEPYLLWKTQTVARDETGRPSTNGRPRCRACCAVTATPPETAPWVTAAREPSTNSIRPTIPTTASWTGSAGGTSGNSPGASSPG